MSEILENHIRSIHSKLQLLLKQYARLEKEHLKLVKENTEYKTANRELEEKIALLDQKVSILKTSMGTLANQEKKDFEKTINEYIRAIDKCISVLNK